MEVGLLPTLNAQILRLDQKYGADSIAIKVVHALLETILGYKGDTSPKELMVEFLHLYELLLACRPRMANIIFDVQKCLLFLHENEGAGVKELRSHLVRTLALKRTRTRKSVRNAFSLLRDNQTLMVHSHSSALQELLSYAAKKGVKPKLIVASQEVDKTNRIIRYVSANTFDFHVVSEYSISHVVDQIDLAIFGGLTINSEGEAVMGPGSASLISQLHGKDVPCYVLCTANKFSYWQETTETAYKEERAKVLDDMHYTKHVYSHDPVSVKLLSGVISERAIHSPLETKALFEELQEEFFEREQLIRGIHLASKNEQE